MASPETLAWHTMSARLDAPSQVPPDGRADGFLFSGNRIDNLKGRPGAIERAVRVDTRVSRRSEPDALRRANRLEAMIGIMRSPLAHRSTRRHVVRLLSATSGVVSRGEATDPSGRGAVFVTLDDQSHSASVDINGTLYELAGKAELTQELYYDPDSFEPLARRVILTDTQVEELEGWLDGQGGTALLREAIYSRPEQVKNRRRKRELSEIPDGLTLHSLRRTFASLLFEAGATVPYVMAQLGHADPKVTLTIYAHVLRRQGDTGRRMDALIRGSVWAESGRIEAERADRSFDLGGPDAWQSCS